MQKTNETKLKPIFIVDTKEDANQIQNSLGNNNYYVITYSSKVVDVLRKHNLQHLCTCFTKNPDRARLLQFGGFSVYPTSSIANTKLLTGCYFYSCISNQNSQ